MIVIDKKQCVPKSLRLLVVKKRIQEFLNMTLRKNVATSCVCELILFVPLNPVFENVGVDDSFSFHISNVPLCLVLTSMLPLLFT